MGFFRDAISVQVGDARIISHRTFSENLFLFKVLTAANLQRFSDLSVVELHIPPISFMIG